MQAGSGWVTLMKHSAPFWQAASSLSPESRISFNSGRGMLFALRQVYSHARGFGSRARGYRQRQQREEVRGNPCGTPGSWPPPPPESLRWPCRPLAGVRSDPEWIHRSGVRKRGLKTFPA